MRILRRTVFGIRARRIMYIALVGFLCIAYTHRTSAQCTMVCSSEINLSLPGPLNNCTAHITPSLLGATANGCGDSLDVDLFLPNGTRLQGALNNQNLRIGVVTSAALGLTITARTSIRGIGQSCETKLNIVDGLVPQLTVTDQVLSIAMDLSPDSGYVGLPQVEECSSYDINYQDSISFRGCSNPVYSSVYRTWIVTDEFGLTSSKIQVLDQLAISLDSVMVPADTSVACDIGSIESVDFGRLSIRHGEEKISLASLDGQLANFYFSHSDESFVGFNGTTQTLRTWRIYDECSAPLSGVNPRSVVQRISQLDTTAPTIVTEIDTLFYFVGSSRCESEVVLPQLIALDNCSPQLDFEVRLGSQFIQNNGGAIGSFAPGNYQALYSIRDLSGNEVIKSIEVVISDNSPPVLLLNPSIQVSLNNIGEAIVTSANFDNGSYDNCSAVNFGIRRLGNGVYEQGVSLTCSDIGQPVRLDILVVDAEGNSNSAEVLVEVVDVLPPNIQLPSVQDLSCDLETNAINNFGLPVILDGCEITVRDTIVDRRDSCGRGQVVRTWLAVDESGNSSTASQSYNFIYSSQVSQSSIHWPVDTILSVCSVTDEIENLSPRLLPRVEDSNCERISISFSDIDFESDEYCQVTLRNWTVLDACLYDGNVSGIWTHTQRINYLDTIKPAPISNVDSLVAFAVEDYCDSVLVNIGSLGYLDCSTLYYEYSYEGIKSNGSSGELYLPVGVERFMQRVTDACGNTSEREVYLNLVDTVAPAFTCLDSSVFYIVQDSLEIDGAAISFLNEPACEVGSSYVSGNFVFDCEDLGDHLLELVVVDSLGNSSSCLSLVKIKDSLNVCAEKTLNYSGVVTSSNSENFSTVFTEISDQGDTIGFYASNLSGSFDIDVFEDDNSRLYPSSSHNPGLGVSSFDLYLIGQHILGVIPFTTVAEYAAADVNDSRSISAYDMTLLRRYMLGLIPDLPGNRSYRFFSNQADLDSLARFRTWTESFGVEVSNEESIALTAIKVGDVNGAKRLGIQGALGNRSNVNQSVEFKLEEEDGRVSLVYNGATPISVSTFDLFLDLPKSKIIVDPFFANDVLFGFREYRTALNWIRGYGETVMLSPGYVIATFKADDIGFLQTLTGSLVILADNGEPVESLIQLRESSLKSMNVSVAPNPLRSGEVLSVKSSSSVIVLELYDMSGRQVKRLEGEDLGRTRGVAENLVEGLYMLRIRFEGGHEQVQRLLIK